MFRCAQGIVVWRLSAARSLGITTARCLNDGFGVQSTLHLDSEIVDFLQSVAAHTVQLRGAISTITQIELPT